METCTLSNSIALTVHEEGNVWAQQAEEAQRASLCSRQQDASASCAAHRARWVSTRLHTDITAAADGMWAVMPQTRTRPRQRVRRREHVHVVIIADRTSIVRRKLRQQRERHRCPACRWRRAEARRHHRLGCKHCQSNRALTPGHAGRRPPPRQVKPTAGETDRSVETLADATHEGAGNAMRATRAGKNGERRVSTNGANRHAEYGRLSLGAALRLHEHVKRFARSGERTDELGVRSPRGMVRGSTAVGGMPAISDYRSSSI